jgi:hypothetical protein
VVIRKNKRTIQNRTNRGLSDSPAVRHNTDAATSTRWRRFGFCFFVFVVYETKQ